MSIGITNPLSPVPNQHRIPTWNNAGRPKKPRRGVLGFNLEIHCLEYWTGTEWLTLIMEKISV